MTPRSPDAASHATRGPSDASRRRPRRVSRSHRLARAGLVCLVAFGAGVVTGVGVSTDGDPGSLVARWWDGSVLGGDGTDGARDVRAATDEGAQRRADVASRGASRDAAGGLPWSTDRGSPAGPFGAADQVGSAPPPTPAAAVVPQLAEPALPALVDGLLVSDVGAGLLSLTVTEDGGGELAVVPGSQPAPGPGPVTTVRIEVETGLAVDPGLFALTVMSTLNDARGWGADGSISFARTDGDADLSVVLASPRLVDELCAPLATEGEFSCGTNGRAVLNLRRWVEGGSGWAGDTVSYRHYLVNHEVGHLLGHRHVTCAGAGRVSDVMQQQSGGTSVCVRNPWPFPTT